MSDNYQAVYDAIRSRFHVDANAAIESVLRDAFGMTQYYMSCVADNYSAAAYEQSRPCVVFKPSLSMDGNKFCALFGEDLVQGVAGFGGSAAEAMADFDKNWFAPGGVAKATT